MTYRRDVSLAGAMRAIRALLCVLAVTVGLTAPGGGSARQQDAGGPPASSGRSVEGAAPSNAPGVPLRMSYQGLLTAGGGGAPADGSYDLTFRIFEAASGGTALWTETHAGVTVTGGTFSLVLGSVAPIGLTFDRTLHLEVTATAGPAGPSYPLTFSPRSELTAAPYALAPWKSKGADIRFTGGMVAIGDTAPASPFVVRGASNWGVSEIVGEGTHAEGSIGFRSSNLAKGALGTWVLGVNNNGGILDSGVFSLYRANGLGWGAQAVSVRTDGRVGINQAYPSRTLSIGGDLQIDGAVYASTSLLLHTTGTSNTFVGAPAGNLSTSGFGKNTALGAEALKTLTTGESNAAAGYRALATATIGSFSTAVGAEALQSATTGGSNTAAGYRALWKTTTASFNTAHGYQALVENSSGTQNVGIGGNAGYSTTTGSYNVSVGMSALSGNITASYNAAVGYLALSGTFNSSYNTAVGANAGRSYDNGWNNVFLGANVDVTSAGLFNVVAVGQATVVTASSTARFGNAATGSYGGWAGWTNVSDARFKLDVREEVPGLSFIAKLRPVTYRFDATGMDVFLRGETRASQPLGELNATHLMALQEKERVTYTGFVAQEVEAAARDLGFDFSGVDAPKNERDYYGLRYAEFVVPLVKAVQEQQAVIETLRREVAELRRLVQSH